MRRRPSSLRDLICRIDVTAFAAVTLALVAMFLLPASIVIHYMGPSADLAYVYHAVPMANALREDALEVSITRDGVIWMGHDRVKLDQLQTAIRDGVGRGAERKVYIRADMRARYGTVKLVLDAVRSQGIENIAFLVERRNPGQRDFLEELQGSNSTPRGPHASRR